MKTVTNEMVDRFLNWPLPADVRSDTCVTMPDYPHRIGTNLLTADQARQMLEYVLATPPKKCDACNDYGVVWNPKHSDSGYLQSIVDPCPQCATPPSETPKGEQSAQLGNDQPAGISGAIPTALGDAESEGLAAIVETIKGEMQEAINGLEFSSHAYDELMSAIGHFAELNVPRLIEMARERAAASKQVMKMCDEQMELAAELRERYRLLAEHREELLKLGTRCNEVEAERDKLDRKLHYTLNEGWNCQTKLQQTVVAACHAAGIPEHQHHLLAEQHELLRREASRLFDEVESQRDVMTAIESIAKVTGCNHTDDPDGRSKLSRCVRETIDSIRADRDRLSAELERVKGERERLRAAMVSARECVDAHEDPEGRKPVELLLTIDAALNTEKPNE